ncbi:MAG: DUF488 family protein [Pyrinomonadaceae bacterium]
MELTGGHTRINTVYTIGHSTQPIENFLALLSEFEIQALIDIRRFPGSRKYPAYNKEALASSLKRAKIEYIHLESLGGRRKAHADSINTAWRNESFRGYADYMQSPEFENGVNELERIARHKITAFMCAEAVWWRCHRSMVSDYLKAKGWNVLHILGTGNAKPHVYTKPARVKDGMVYYSNDSSEDVEKD